jgi:hypothetical protein
MLVHGFRREDLIPLWGWRGQGRSHISPKSQPVGEIQTLSLACGPLVTQDAVYRVSQ